MDGTVRYEPGWRNALHAIESGAYTYGDLIPTDDLYRMLNLERPVGRITAEEHNKHRLQFMGQLDELKRRLLHENNMALAADNGRGYRIVLPEEQTEYAVKMGFEDLRKAIRKMGNLLTCIDYARLNDERRKANADALSRVAAARGSIRRIERGQLPEVPKRLARQKK